MKARNPRGHRIVAGLQTGLIRFEIAFWLEARIFSTVSRPIRSIVSAAALLRAEMFADLRTRNSNSVY